MASLLTKNKSHRVYSALQVRELDQLAIQEYQIPGLELMRRAGRAAFDVMRLQYPYVESIIVLAGSGNNGGDGYILAALAARAGMEVQVLTIGNLEHQTADARAARALYLEECANETAFGDSIPVADVIIDAILGTGLQSALNDAYAAAIEAVNVLQAPILSLDIPSGLHADTGIPMPIAVQADFTVTFVGIKTGLLTGAAADYVGALYYDGLGIPGKAFTQIRPLAKTTSQPMLLHRLPARKHSTYKTQLGHALLLGSNIGFPNAIRLSAEACARCGTGLVTVATHEHSFLPVCAGCPTAMVRTLNQPADISDLLAKVNVIAIGPGLGLNTWARTIFAYIVTLHKQLLLDADALTLLAQDPIYNAHWVLTPHPGEAARLLNCSVHQIQQDRISAARAIAEKYGGTVVLKGAGTLVYSDGQLWINHYASAALASGGTGDVLTGIISALLAQGLEPVDAAACGVYLHSQAADLASREGDRGMLASDLMKPLRRLVNP